VVSLPCSRTRDNRAEPWCIAQHGAHFVLDEPSGFWVAWSVHYNQLLEQLFPDVLSEFPPAQCQVEFSRLCAHLFFSRNPSSTLPEGAQSGINPLDAPTGIARLRLIPWDGSSCDVRSGFQPDPSSNVASARGATMRFSFSGVLEYLDGELSYQPMVTLVAKVFPQIWRPWTAIGFLKRNLHLLGVSSWAKRWTRRLPPQDCRPVISWAPHSRPYPPLGRGQLGLPTRCLERKRDPVSGHPPNREPIARLVERSVPIPRVLNPLPPRQLSPPDLLLSQLKTPLSPFAPFHWRDSVRKEPLCALCFHLVVVVTTLAICACWRLREGCLGRPHSVVLPVSLYTQRVVPGRSSPTPMRMGTTRCCGVSGWPFGNT
jgi:hypothetical protein